MLHCEVSMASRYIRPFKDMSVLKLLTKARRNGRTVAECSLRCVYWHFSWLAHLLSFLGQWRFFRGLPWYWSFSFVLRCYELNDAWVMIKAGGIEIYMFGGHIVNRCYSPRASIIWAVTMIQMECVGHIVRMVLFMDTVCAGWTVCIIGWFWMTSLWVMHWTSVTLITLVGRC